MMELAVSIRTSVGIKNAHIFCKNARCPKITVQIRFRSRFRFHFKNEIPKNNMNICIYEKRLTERTHDVGWIGAKKPKKLLFSNRRDRFHFKG